MKQLRQIANINAIRFRNFLDKKQEAKDISPIFTFQGHRGARGLLPENTVASFQKSFELGIHTVELDVVVSKDEQLVVSHEEWFSANISTKPNGQPITKAEEMQHLIYQMPYSEVKKYDCGQRGHILFLEQQPQKAYKPLLKEVVEQGDLFSETKGLQVPIYNIEIKTSEQRGDGYLHPTPKKYAEIVYRTLKELDIENRVLVQSFDVRLVQAMKTIAPHLKLSLLLDNAHSLDWNIKQLGFVPNVYAPYYQFITRKLVQDVHALGAEIITWTVNEPKDMLRLMYYGVDSIITDYPDRAAKLLKSLQTTLRPDRF